MKSIKNTFGINVGYSDHTLGVEVAIAAVAIGASVIEKHITLDKKMEGPVHSSSVEENELRLMIKSIRNGDLPTHFDYGLELDHKHIPEMIMQTGLQSPPLFMPSVGLFEQGMLVRLAIPKSHFAKDVSIKDIFELYQKTYSDHPLIRVCEQEFELMSKNLLRLSADGLAGQDGLEIYCFNNPKTDFDVEFENTEAFRWLKKNAAKYHFKLSFDKNNKNVDYEPWHWRYEGSIKALKIFEASNRRALNKRD